MELFGVVYTSVSTRSMTPAALDNLLLVSRAKNAATGITGVLLYGDRRFFQYLEGERDDVAQVYARICRSAAHTDLVELEYQQIPRRLFTQWFMGFRKAPGSLLQQLNQQQWARERPSADDHSAHSAGMRQLMDFLDEDGAVDGSSATKS